MGILRILCVVEDGPKLQELEATVANAGYEVVRARTGDEALKLLKSQGVDGVVLEYQVQIPGGVSLRNWLRRMSPELPVLLISSNDDVRTIPLEIFGAYLENPASPEKVLEAMSR